MGEGYGFQCTNCGKYYEANVGRGMDYERLYESALLDIRSEKYGKKLKAAYEQYENKVTIDPELVVYICPKCGNWKNQRDFTLYEQGSGKILRKYERKCGKCNEKMRKASTKELMKLSCPKCHCAPDAVFPTNLIMWD